VSTRELRCGHLCEWRREAAEGRCNRGQRQGRKGLACSDQYRSQRTDADRVAVARQASRGKSPVGAESRQREHIRGGRDSDAEAGGGEIERRQDRLAAAAALGGRDLVGGMSRWSCVLQRSRQATG